MKGFKIKSISSDKVFYWRDRFGVKHYQEADTFEEAVELLLKNLRILRLSTSGECFGFRLCYSNNVLARTVQYKDSFGFLQHRIKWSLGRTTRKKLVNLLTSKAS